MKTLKVVLLGAATALILLLTPRAAAAQSTPCNLIYQTGINSDEPPSDPNDDCPKSSPIIGSFIASALAVGLVLLLAIRSFVLGASPRDIPEPALSRGRSGNTTPRANAPAKPAADSANAGTQGVHPRTGIPSVTDAKLKNYIDQLYRHANRPGTIGNGTTMDAIRLEIAAGGGRHIQKGHEIAAVLPKWLRRNPGATHHDRLVAQSLYYELVDALGYTS